MGDLYTVVTWPDSQELMDKEGFNENCYLINDDKGMEEFGSSAYFVNKEWLDRINEQSTNPFPLRGNEQ